MQQDYIKVLTLSALIVATTIVAGGAYYAQNVVLTPPPNTITPAAPTPQPTPMPEPTPIPVLPPLPIPGPTPTPRPAPINKACSGPGDIACSSGYTCIQRCGPPVAREGDPAPGYYCETNEIAAKPRMCPICLASNTQIDTPSGLVNVKDIRTGALVWSMNAESEKIASHVIEISHTDVPSNHHVIHLVLTDHREVWVSANHPTANGKIIGNLKIGDNYDGSRIIVADLIPYWDTATYDLLPDSATGYYWANGILLGSTLKR